MGQKVQLSFALPDQKSPVELEGVVARTDASHRVLVCFTVISQADRGRIRDFLAGKAV